MSIGNCFYEKDGLRCTSNAVMIDVDGDEWCEAHFPKDKKLQEDFREDKPNDLA